MSNNKNTKKIAPSKVWILFDSDRNILSVYRSAERAELAASLWNIPRDDIRVLEYTLN